MGTLLLVLSGIWALRHIPLDALPDISDVEVIIHTPWAGQPPNIIEDQVTYPMVTTLLAAPRVKAVRAQTMFGTLTSMRFLRTARTCIGRVRVFWNTCRKSPGACPKPCIRSSAPMQPERAGSTSTSL